MAATYKLRLPLLEAVQYNEKNDAEVKKLVGDESEGKEILVSAEPQQWEEKPIEGAEPVEVTIEPPPRDPNAPKTKKEVPKQQVEKKVPLKVKKDDWVTKDTANGKVEVNPEGFPDKYEQLAGF
jgi:hypothetical protein